MPEIRPVEFRPNPLEIGPSAPLHCSDEIVVPPVRAQIMDTPAAKSPGRRCVLDEAKKRQVVAMVTLNTYQQWVIR